MNGGKTGYPPGLLQDDCRPLSRWFASKPDARQRVREVAAEIQAQHCCNGNCNQGRTCPTWQACAVPEPEPARKKPVPAKPAVRRWLVIALAATYAVALIATFPF